jgi:hypothetical protein
MKSLLPATLLLTATLAQAQLRKPTLEETAAQRWTETNQDKVVGIAAGTPIILSEVRHRVLRHARAGEPGVAAEHGRPPARHRGIQGGTR